MTETRFLDLILGVLTVAPIKLEPVIKIPLVDELEKAYQVAPRIDKPIEIATPVYAHEYGAVSYTHLTLPTKA